MFILKELNAAVHGSGLVSRLRNDSSIDLCQKVKNDNYHLGQLNRPVSQIDIQRNNIMVGFVVDGHILMTFTT